MSRTLFSPRIQTSVWFIVVCVLLFAPAMLVYKMKSSKQPASTLNPLSTQIASKSVQPPIVKTVGEKVIDYRMYGRVVQVGKEVVDGIGITFVLDADPIQTVMAGFIQPHSKAYELIRYDANFKQKLAMENVSGTDLIVQALSSSRSLEFGLVFPKVGFSTDDEARMRGLDGIIRGDWKSLPSKRLMISSIGVRARM